MSDFDFDFVFDSDFDFDFAAADFDFDFLNHSFSKTVVLVSNGQILKKWWPEWSCVGA